jgi:hypothetical protein
MLTIFSKQNISIIMPSTLLESLDEKRTEDVSKTALKNYVTVLGCYQKHS